MKRILLLAACVFVVGLTQNACQGRPVDATLLSADYGYVDLPEELLGRGNAAKREEIRQREQRLTRLYTTSDFDLCARELQDNIARDPADTWSWYNLACIRARQGDNDAAMAALHKAVEHGFCNLQRVQHDRDLAPLGERDDFQRLLQRDHELQWTRAKRIEAVVGQKLEGRYNTVIDDRSRVIFTSTLSDDASAPVRQRLAAHAQAAWNELFDHPIRQYVTVVVLDPSQMDKIPAGGGGWYDDNQHTILTIQTGIILTHEFTHALHHADQIAHNQTHPTWIKEGLATLFETSQLLDGRLKPLHNFRLRAIQQAVRQDRTIPLRTFLGMRQSEFMNQSTTCYPQSRYLMWYLHEKGLLKAWYDAYTATYSQDRTGGLALEAVCGQRLDHIERDWKIWVGQLTHTGTLPGDRDNIGLRLPT